jgi:hypothetical protein
MSHFPYCVELFSVPVPAPCCAYPDCWRAIYCRRAKAATTAGPLPQGRTHPGAATGAVGGYLIAGDVVGCRTRDDCNSAMPISQCE